MVKAQQQIELIETTLPKKKLKWAEVTLNEVLERGKRIEGSYFNIEGKRARQAIMNCGYEVLSIAGANAITDNVYYPSRFKRIYLEKGIPFFLSFQSLEQYPQPVKFISDRTNVDFETLRLKEYQILLTRSGTIGQVSYVGKTLANKLFSDDLIRVECNDATNRGFLYAFLRSRLGFLTVTTNTYGSVVTHIEPEHLENVPIPNPPERVKKPIAYKIFKAVRLRDEANELLQRAEDIFFEKLKLKRLPDLKPKFLNKSKCKAFNVKLSQLNKRVDGSYHNPLAIAIIKELKKADVDLTTCGDSRISKNIILPGRFKRYYVEEEYGMPFLSGKNIFQINPVDIKYLSKVKHKKQLDLLGLQENMILITCSGTIGRVQIAPKYFNNFTANQHILRLITSEHVNEGYVYCFLASEYGRVLIQKFTYGSVVDEIDDNHLASVPFPILRNKNLENEIGSLILKANKMRNEARELENEAVSEVEELIPM